MKYNLKKMFLNEIDKNKSLKYKYTQLAGFANPTALHKFLTEEKREMNNFDGLLNMVRFSFLDREKEIMDSYIRTLDPNGKCARVSLEYAICNRMHDLAYYLIDRLSKSNNAESKEWAALYLLDRKVENGEVSQFESIEIINGMRLKTKEGIIFSKLLQIYAYQEKRLFEMMFQISEGLEIMIKKLADNYMRYSYLCRLAIAMASVNIHQNKISEARRYGQLVLDNTTQDSLRYLAYINLGNSYMFDNPEKAIDYLNQARLICKGLDNNSYKMAEVERSLNFVMNYWEIPAEYLNFESTNISDIHEVAFYYIRNNDRRGLQILESINIDDLTPSQKGFHFFYRGLATKDKKYFYESLKYFNIAGDKYYKQISLIELKKLGTEEDYILDALSV